MKFYDFKTIAHLVGILLKYCQEEILMTENNLECTQKLLSIFFCRLWHDRDKPRHAVYATECAAEQGGFMWANCTFHTSQSSGPNNRAITGASSVW
jgi:hypothetical protein